MRNGILSVTAMMLASSMALTPTYAAGTDSRLSVLGVHLNDRADAAKDNLAKQGFEISYYSQCEKTFGEMVKTVADRHQTIIESGCAFSAKDKAGRDVNLGAVMYPDGFHISAVTYTFPFVGSRDDLKKLYAAKYGNPTSKLNLGAGPLPAYTTPTDAKGQVGLAIVPSLVGGATVTMTDTGQLRKASEVAVARAAASRTGADKLKL